MRAKWQSCFDIMNSCSLLPFCGNQLMVQIPLLMNWDELRQVLREMCVPDGSTTSRPNTTHSSQPAPSPLRRAHFAWLSSAVPWPFSEALLLKTLQNDEKNRRIEDYRRMFIRKRPQMSGQRNTLATRCHKHLWGLIWIKLTWFKMV
jgi:hypothetical protein